MYPMPPPQYFQQLNAYLQAQSKKLQELESKIGQLQQELETIKKQRTMTVERIEYKFDQLKIEKLDGTLHIGISPDLGKAIDDFTVDGSAVQMTKTDSDMRARIRRQIDRFLDEDVVKLINELEQSTRVVLGEQYIGFMIQDMKSQVDGRIAHYMQTVSDDLPGMTASPTKEEAIVEKIKTDIRIAIERHLHEKTDKGEDAL